MAIALFPGQGSLKPGMGISWLEDEAFAYVDEISSITGVDVRYLLSDAAGEELRRTDNAQLATFALSIAIFFAAIRHDADFDLTIGHSLGEYSALVCSEIISLHDGASLVLERGRAMADAAATVPGSMVAVLGTDDTIVEAAVQGFDGLVVANRNAPGQVVVAGPSAQLERLREQSRDLGLRRVVPLEVGGAFHSPLMAPARQRLDHALTGVEFHHGQLQVVANVDATPYEGGPWWRKLLGDQLTSTVEFERSIRGLGEGAGPFVECGPGGVLGGLVKRTIPDATVIGLATPDDVSHIEVPNA